MIRAAVRTTVACTVGTTVGTIGFVLNITGATALRTFVFTTYRVVAVTTRCTARHPTIATASVGARLTGTC